MTTATQEATTTTTTTTAPKRASRATKSATRNATTKSAAPKSTTKAKAAPKVQGPSERQQRQEVISLLVAAGAKIVSEWNPARHHDIPAEVALAGIKQALGYTPGECWSYVTAHPVLGVRDVGRPAPVAKKS